MSPDINPVMLDVENRREKARGNPDFVVPFAPRVKPSHIIITPKGIFAIASREAHNAESTPRTPTDQTKKGKGDVAADIANADLQRQFMELAVKEARKCKPEDDRVHPKVGVVVVKDGAVLATAYRGEMGEGEHAEFTALERKLRDVAVAGATVYTTLEPCTAATTPSCRGRVG